jgi:hypothetical protein
MSEGVLVAGAEARGQRLTFRLLAAVGVLAAVCLLTSRDLRGLGIVIAVAAVVTLAVSEAVAAARRRARRWVADTGSGFRWFGGPDELTVADGQVTALRLAHERKFSQGLVKYVIRRFVVWTGAARQPMEMATRLRPGEADPLAALIGRIVEDLKTRSAGALMQGVPLQGDGWSLTSQELVLTAGRQQHSIPFAQLESIGLFDGKLCLWCRGQDEPAARLDPGSRNVPVLSALVGAWIERQEAATGQERQADQPPTGAASEGGPVFGLGRLLFERPGRTAPALPTCLFLAAGVLSVFAFVAGYWPVGLTLVVLAVGMLVWAFAKSRTVFRCHERGVYRRTYKSETRIPYQEMSEFTFSATRFFHNGVYTGTQLSMIFRSPQNSIRYSASVRNLDADLDELRDHIAKVIAHRMLAQLQQGQVVPWTADLTLLPAGLQFRRQGFLGKQPPQVIAYDQIRGVDIQKGVFFLWNQTAPKPIFQTEVAKPNFFPGFYALLMQMQPRE